MQDVPKGRAKHLARCHFERAWCRGCPRAGPGRLLDTCCIATLYMVVPRCVWLRVASAWLFRACALDARSSDAQRQAVSVAATCLQHVSTSPSRLQRVPTTLWRRGRVSGLTKPFSGLTASRDLLKLTECLTENAVEYIFSHLRLAWQIANTKTFLKPVVSPSQW